MSKIQLLFSTKCCKEHAQTTFRCTFVFFVFFSFIHFLFTSILNFIFHSFSFLSNFFTPSFITTSLCQTFVAVLVCVFPLNLFSFLCFCFQFYFSINKISLIQVSFCSNTGPIRDYPYWSSSKNSLELIELSSLKTSLFAYVYF